MHLELTLQKIFSSLSMNLQITSQKLTIVFISSLHNDIDVGDISGGLPEWGDDKMNFIKSQNLIYFYDDGVSGEWPDGKTGFFGVMILKTPEVNGTELGITDMHYMLYDDDDLPTKIQFNMGIMSSDPDLYNSPVGNKYFHLGSNPDIFISMIRLQFLHQVWIFKVTFHRGHI